MTTQIKFDWDKKRDEMIARTNNNPEELKRYILNEKNTRITKKYVEEVFRNYGINYEVYDMGVFNVSMTHSAYTNKDYREIKNLKSILMGVNFLKNEELIPISNEQKHMAVSLGETSYERLEIVGDGLLRQIITDYLFIRYKDMDEGDITKLRSQIENGSSLAEMARRIGLPKYMLIPRNLEAMGVREKNNKYQCDIFEAFIAAIYYDSMGIKYSDIGNRLDLIQKNRGKSFDLCFQFVTNLIEDEIDLTLLLETETNHKDELLQQYHKLGWGDPKYNVMETIIDENKMGKKYFKMYVRDIDGNIIGTGIGSSKQKGEKLSAKKALQYLKIIPDDNEDIILDQNSTEIYHRNAYTNTNKNKNIDT
jgi:ribonuclease-3